jgi:hypothetical protein
VFDTACKLGSRGNRVEAGRQPLSQRGEPQLAQVLKPDVHENMSPTPLGEKARGKRA